jgi:hypothetical protein
MLLVHVLFGRRGRSGTPVDTGLVPGLLAPVL